MQRAETSERVNAESIKYLFFDQSPWQAASFSFRFLFVGGHCCASRWSRSLRKDCIFIILNERIVGTILRNTVDKDIGQHQQDHDPLKRAEARTDSSGLRQHRHESQKAEREHPSTPGGTSLGIYTRKNAFVGSAAESEKTVFNVERIEWIFVPLEDSKLLVCQLWGGARGARDASRRCTTHGSEYL